MNQVQNVRLSTQDRYNGQITISDPLTSFHTLSPPATRQSNGQSGFAPSQLDRYMRNQSLPGERDYLGSLSTIPTRSRAQPTFTNSSQEQAAKRRASAFAENARLGDIPEFVPSGIMRPNQERKGIPRAQSNGQIQKPWNSNVAMRNDTLGSLTQEQSPESSSSSNTLVSHSREPTDVHVELRGLDSDGRSGKPNGSLARDTASFKPQSALRNGDWPKEQSKPTISNSSRKPGPITTMGPPFSVPFTARDSPRQHGVQDQAATLGSRPMSDLERSFNGFGFAEGPNHRQISHRSSQTTPTSAFSGGPLTRTTSSSGTSPRHLTAGWNGAIDYNQLLNGIAGSPQSLNHPNQPASGHVEDGFRHPSALWSNPDPKPVRNQKPTISGYYNQTFAPASDPYARKDLSRYRGYPNDYAPTFNGFDPSDYYARSPAAQYGSRHAARSNQSPVRDIPMYENANGIPIGPPSVNIPAQYGMPQSDPWQTYQFYSQGPADLQYVRDNEHGLALRSQLMDDFKSAHRAGSRWDVKDIYGNVVEFCGDQVGSRFLQDKLKTANSEEKDRVFAEILENAVPLMKDVFGNYVLQKFFEHGDQAQKAALVTKMRGHMYELSTQTYACRVVQKGLAHILVKQQVDLLHELDGRVMDCIKCENGNHVIQVAIEQVPLKHIPFLVNAIQHDVQYLSMHKYGCRIVQRLLEHAHEDVLIWLIPELHRCSNLLIADQFGNYVPAHIVEKGTMEDRDKIIEVVRQDLIRFSMQKFASHVAEKCIRFGEDYHRRQFVEVFCAPDKNGEDQLEHLIRDSFANYVIQSMMEMLQGSDYMHFCRRIEGPLQRAKLPCATKQTDNISKKMAFYYSQPAYIGTPTWNNSVFIPT